MQFLEMRASEKQGASKFYAEKARGRSPKIEKGRVQGRGYPFLCVKPSLNCVMGAERNGDGGWSWSLSEEKQQTEISLSHTNTQESKSVYYCNENAALHFTHCPL